MKEKNKKTGHMTLRIEGETKEEKIKFLKGYYRLSRKGKRDLMRRQKRIHINYRAETTKGAFGQSKLQKAYTSRVRLFREHQNEVLARL